MGIHRPKPFFTPFRLILLLLILGVIASLFVAAGMWLLSEGTSDLPPAAEDLSILNQWYLRLYLRFHEGKLNTPAVSEDGLFEVQEGETALQICQRLQEQHWVPSSEMVVNYLVYTGGDRSISAGVYILHEGQSPRQVADALSGGSTRIKYFTMFPGWRLEEAAQSLPALGVPISAADFLSAASVRPGIGTNLEDVYAQIPAGRTLEGFLMPGEYIAAPGISAEALIQEMMWKFQTDVPDEWVDHFQTNGLDLYQAVTFASIIQRETQVEEEMPLIASVFYNRLRNGMPLQTDPTVQYALGYQADRNGWWANPLRETDFSLDSPYNTYLYSGLPPGPICSPGVPALKATAFPEESPYFYFQAACDGSGRHVFAETLAQHQANSCGVSP